MKPPRWTAVSESEFSWEREALNALEGLTGDIALRLAHWFESPQFWMNLQALYDLRMAEQEAGTEIKALSTKPVAKAKPKTHRPRPV